MQKQAGDGSNEHHFEHHANGPKIGDVEGKFNKMLSETLGVNSLDELAQKLRAGAAANHPPTNHLTPERLTTIKRIRDGIASVIARECLNHGSDQTLENIVHTALAATIITLDRSAFPDKDFANQLVGHIALYQIQTGKI